MKFPASRGLLTRLAVALSCLAGATTPAQAEDLDTLVARIATAVAAGECPDRNALDAVRGLVLDARAADLGAVYKRLHDQLTLGGLPFSVVWNSAVAAPGVSLFSEQLRWLTACFGTPEPSAESYKAMLDILAPTLKISALDGLLRDTDLGLLVTTTREALDKLPGRIMADLSVNGSIIGTYAYTFRAGGQFDREDVADPLVGRISPEAVADDPAAAVAAKWRTIDPLLLLQEDKGYTEVAERVYVQSWLTGFTLFTIDNVTTWHWNYKKRYVFDGQAFKHWNITTYGSLPRGVYSWEFHDWKREDAGYASFANGRKGKGEYFHRITGWFKFGANLGPWGSFTMSQSWPYANIYGHFDGMESHYEGDSKGYPTDWCVAENIEYCDED